MCLPVLHGVKGESADLVEREGVGIVFEPGNSENFATSLQKMADNPALRTRLQRNGLAAARKFDRSVLAMQMLGHLELLVEKQ